MDVPTRIFNSRQADVPASAASGVTAEKTNAADSERNFTADFNCSVQTDGKAAQEAPAGAADALSAMGIVVAVVTLLLTIGIAYLVEQQSKIERLVAMQQASQRIDSFLELAKSEILEHFLSHGNPKAAAVNSLKVGVLLSALRSTSEESRAAANDRLLTWLGPAVKHELPCTIRYCEELRAWIRANKDTNGQKDSIGFLEGKAFT